MSRERLSLFYKTEKLMKDCPKLNKRELMAMDCPLWAIQEVCDKKGENIEEWGEPDKTKDGLEIIKERKELKSKLPILTASELLKFKKPKNFIIENHFFPSDIIMSAGNSGSFKSLYTLYEAVCICKGRKLLNAFKTRKRNVLILSLENSKFVDGSRLKTILRGLNVRKPNNLYFLSRGYEVDLLDKDFKEKLKDFIEEKKIGVLYIDTINPAIPEIDDNKAQDVMRVFTHFFFPFTKKGLAIKFLHHSDKNNRNFLGSMKWKANSDVYFFFDRDSLKNEITISNEKNRWGEHQNLKIRVVGDVIGTDFVKTSFELIEQKGFGRAKIKKSTKTERAKKKIQEILSKNSATYSELLKEVIKEDICKENTFKKALRELKAQDKIKEEGDNYQND